MDVARLNTAHMTLDEAAEVIANIRAVSENIGIMIDTKGPNIRSCGLGQPLELKTGDEIEVSGNPVEQGKGFQVNYARFPDEVSPGQQIIIDDGEMALEILSRKNRVLRCRALNDGKICDRKSVNVPNAVLRTPALTQRDREFIDFAIRNNVDFIAHSFVRDRDDVMAVQSLLDTADSPIKIIAKIENRQGVENLDSILDVAYGIMVARGDLGIEIPVEEVPQIQKKMIYECMRRHKPSITATQMLQSMISNPRPTRAEVSDVANAVLDGTDAVMLSGETAQGRYPLESIEMMSRIIRRTESSSRKLFTRVEQVEDPADPIRSYVVKAAIDSAASLPVQAIVCNTGSGESCNLCAAYRGTAPIFAFSYKKHVVRQLSLSHGVYAGYLSFQESTHALMKMSVEQLIAEGKIHADDLLVLLAQLSSGHPGTDLCAIIRPADVFAGDVAIS